ncbi:2-phosphosulfolactate phosphatase [Paenibacillus silvisoli]|uniref:2-phosphosulfolactate phosphatase n=1 Tax=Paenibacillus silvisoli TaxID=3110539 RepID=UPI002805DEA2|nr:2-phosphosulfolactate phosphatase [Paenibacillus silvisoli]
MFNQAEYRVRFEWGAEGVTRLAPCSDVVVIIDVLSFTTCVDIAVSSGAFVYPYLYNDESAIGYAQSVGAILAEKRGSGEGKGKGKGKGPSLSPASLTALQPQTRIVLPSPNGSTCTVMAQAWHAATIAGCLRNANAVADYIHLNYPDEVISVIACGERWENGALRPAIEDLIAAGAILSRFNPKSLSPEARIAVGAFKQAEQDLPAVLLECSSGRELIEKGYEQDVRIASELNVSPIVPIYHNGAYTQRTFV